MSSLKEYLKYINVFGVNTLFTKLFKKFKQKINASILKAKSGDNHTGLSYLYNNYNQVKHHLLNKSNLKFKENIELIKEDSLYPKKTNQILEEANKYCNNKFKILGQNWIQWSREDGEIDWHTDKKSGFTWDKNTYYSDVKTRVSNSDIKVPWELNRFHFLFTLLFAYLHTENKKFYKKIKYFINNWIKNNPTYYGVNWCNPMEVSLRIANWSLVLYALKSEICKDDEFFRSFINSLWEHLNYINKNWEDTALVNSNHYVANLSGFLIANLFFPIFDKSKKWSKEAADNLQQEMKRQVYSDGGHFESSTNYHCLVLELFTYPYYLSNYFGKNLFNRSYRKNLYRMYKLIPDITKPSLSIIQLGDNDSGRLFKLFDRPSLNKNHLISFAYCLFNNTRFNIKEIPYDILSFIFFGSDYSYKNTSHSIHNISSKRYSDSGIYILRNADFYLAISGMPAGRKGFGTHAHNDKLSIILTYKDNDILVDPGTNIYTSNPQIRNQFRSTEFHNTIKENNYQQNYIDEDMFKISDDSEIQIINWDGRQITLSHNGFINKGGNIHTRHINLSRDYITIHDKIESNHLCKAYFHFSPSNQIIKNNTGYIIEIDDQNLLTFEITNAINTNLKHYNYSPNYGETIEGKKLEISFKNNLKTKFTKYKK